MTAAGSIAPAKVLILGAGVAGLQAIATARRLGAVVEVFDTRPAVKEEVKSLGAKFIEVEGAINNAASGGYAMEQSAEFKERQQQRIAASVAKVGYRYNHGPDSRQKSSGINNGNHVAIYETRIGDH